MASAAVEDKQYKYCLRCGRKLKTEENRARGMGKVCWQKYQHTTQRKGLF